MRVYFMRHGATDWNERGRIQGQADVPLNGRGKAQARQAARFLASLPLDEAYCSPLIRARETAQIVLQSRRCPVFADERLKEISYGAGEGTSIPLIRSSPEMSLWAYFEAPERYLPCESAESLEELFVRCRSFLGELAAREGCCGNILVSGHGAWIRGAICTVQGFDKADFWKGNEQKNCSITLLECQNGKWKLLQDAVSAEALVRMGKSGRI